jgi:hypothetical protein
LGVLDRGGKEVDERKAVEKGGLPGRSRGKSGQRRGKRKGGREGRRDGRREGGRGAYFCLQVQETARRLLQGSDGKVDAVLEDGKDLALDRLKTHGWEEKKGVRTRRQGCCEKKRSQGTNRRKGGGRDMTLQARSFLSSAGFVDRKQ